MTGPSPSTDPREVDPHLYVVPVCPKCRGQAQYVPRLFSDWWLCVACGNHWKGDPDYVYAEEARS